MKERREFESGSKEKDSKSEQIGRLTSEEYFKGQKEIQLMLITNEKALEKGSGILKNRRALEEKTSGAVRDMVSGNMDTFPEYKKGERRHAAAVGDPREFVAQADEEWKDYNEHYREEVARTLEKIGHFCKTWELDFNPYSRDDISPKILWKELQKAYHAKMFETQSGYEGESDFREM